MARERWTVEIELDVETGAGYPCSASRTADVAHLAGCTVLVATRAGLHSHREARCQNVLPWRVVKREPVE